MTSYTFEIPGEPVAKARPRFGKGKRVYTPTKSKDFEYLVANKAFEVIPSPLHGSVALNIDFELPRPKRLIWKTKPMPRCYCDRRPDIDNLVKSVCDGLNTIAFKDDGQVAGLIATKFYHAGDGRPKTVITVSSIL